MDWLTDIMFSSREIYLLSDLYSEFCYLFFTVLEDHISLLNRKKGQQNSGCINSSFTSSSYRSDQHPHNEFQ